MYVDIQNESKTHVRTDLLETTMREEKNNSFSSINDYDRTFTKMTIFKRGRERKCKACKMTTRERFESKRENREHQTHYLNVKCTRRKTSERSLLLILMVERQTCLTIEIVGRGNGWILRRPILIRRRPCRPSVVTGVGSSVRRAIPGRVRCFFGIVRVGSGRVRGVTRPRGARIGIVRCSMVVVAIGNDRCFVRCRLTGEKGDDEKLDVIGTGIAEGVGRGLQRDVLVVDVRAETKNQMGEIRR